MATDLPSDAHPILRKLESTFGVSDEERQAVLDLPLQVTQLRADQDVVREGDRPTRCCAILEGFACTYSMTGDGRRQIMSFHISGDIADLQSLHIKVLDNSLSTITPCKVGFIQHEALRNLCRKQPRIGDALWRDTLIDAAVFREWMKSIGRRDAHARIAHLLCEMVVRMQAVGRSDGLTCDFPITQAEIGDALGLSLVHVNRTIQELRGAGLITLRSNVLTVLDWERLQEVGDFDAAYLHLEEGRGAA